MIEISKKKSYVPFPLQDHFIWSNYSDRKHDLNLNGRLVRQITLFQENLGWLNIMIWPDFMQIVVFSPTTPINWRYVPREWMLVQAAPASFMLFATVNLPGEMLPGSQKDQWDERSIYLHLFDFYGKSVGNDTSQMDCMGNETMKLVNLPTFIVDDVFLSFSWSWIKQSHWSYYDLWNKGNSSSFNLHDF